MTGVMINRLLGYGKRKKNCINWHIFCIVEKLVFKLEVFMKIASRSRYYGVFFEQILKGEIAMA
jgi:hypothetical protein